MNFILTYFKSKLIRTTYWTRSLTNKRPDEVDDFGQSPNDNESISEIELAIDLQPVESKVVHLSRKNRLVRTILSICCGFDKSNSNINESNEKMITRQNETESRRRVENFYSLNRTKFEKYILNINLCLILLIATCLYVFFSVPHGLQLFKKAHLNGTNV